MTERVNCPFKERGYCDSSCQNFSFNSQMLKKAADEANVGVGQLVAAVVNDLRTVFMAPIMKNLHPNISVRCKNNTLH